MRWCGLDWPGSGLGQVQSSCQHGSECLGFIKCWEAIEWLHNWWPLKYCSAPQS
jgi:hypothetical protein